MYGSKIRELPNGYYWVDPVTNEVVVGRTRRELRVNIEKHRFRGS